MTEFTPVASFLGGALIGLSAVLLMALNGRIAGMSGILAGLLPPAAAGVAWRLAFLAGAVAAPLLLAGVTGREAGFESPVGGPWLILGGLIVGIGTYVGSGCSSGHGVCGIARVSPRSLVATGIFMATAFVTVFVVRHVL